MKKIMMIAALMVMTIAAKAQNAVGELTLKPMVGMTIANITDCDGDSKIGLAAGAEFEYGVTEKFGVTFGALYSMQGTKASLYDEDYGNATNKIKLEYINIPILANLYVAPGFAIKAGIQPAFKVSSKDKVEVNGYSGEADLDGVKSFDFSIPVGISYEISDFVIDARYQWGLTKVFEGGDCKNSVFMISLGYKFGL